MSPKKKNPSKPRDKPRCKLLWGQKSSKEKEGATTGKVKTDTTWAYQYAMETVGLVEISAKAGNKDMALDGYSETSKTKISESLLRRRYR